MAKWGASLMQRAVSSDALKRTLKGSPLEAPARAFIEWRNPTWRQDRLDNERLRLLIAFTFREDSCGVDVGAHKGLFLREMLRVAPKGHHVGFEALPELAGPLAAEFPHAEVHSAAVGAEPGEMTFMRNRGIPAQSGMAGRRELGGQDLEAITVPVVALDDVLTHAPTLIKIDVEGAEGYVLKGARKTLAQHRPIVWFEHGAAAARECGTEPAEIYSLLTGLGMRIFDVNGHGPYTLAEFEHPPVWSFIAR